MMLKTLCILLLGLLPVVSRAAPPERIITLGTSITETVYALGEAQRLVGVDSTSLYPAAATKLPDVGYLRTLSAEGLLSLQPDLIIASHEAGPPQVIEQLRHAGVRVEVIQTGPAVEQALSSMETVGTLLHKADAGRELARRNREQLAQLGKDYAHNAHKPRVLFVLGGHGSQPTISGRDTKAHSMIELAMGQNVANSFSSYRPGSAEALLQLKPDVIVAASHGIETSGDLSTLLEGSGLALTPAGRQGRVIVMDSGLLLGMGPRLGQAAIELAAQIHPPLSAKQD